KHFSSGKDKDKTIELETAFLCRYDIGFRFRRAEYVRRRIDAMLAPLATNGAALKDLLHGDLNPPIVDAAVERLRAAKDETTRELYRQRDQIEFPRWRLSYEGERIR